MVKVKQLTLNADKTADAVIYADTKEEVATSSIAGLPRGYSIAAGSTLYTASLDVAVMQSNGIWKW